MKSVVILVSATSAKDISFNARLMVIAFGQGSEATFGYNSFQYRPDSSDSGWRKYGILFYQ